MPGKTITIGALPKTSVYAISTAAELARVSVDFIIECESQEIIEPFIIKGQKHLDINAVRQLIRVRHLHQDLGLELTAIDCILRMREKILFLQQKIHQMEKQLAERERTLIDEINRLKGK